MELKRTRRALHRRLSVSRRHMLRSAPLVASGAALAACGPARPGAAPEITQSRQPVTLRWSTYGTGTDPFVQAAEQGLALFKQQQPHITVEAEPQAAGWQEKNLSQ